MATCASRLPNVEPIGWSRLTPARRGVTFNDEVASAPVSSKRRIVSYHRGVLARRGGYRQRGACRAPPGEGAVSVDTIETTLALGADTRRGSRRSPVEKVAVSSVSGAYLGFFFLTCLCVSLGLTTRTSCVVEKKPPG